VWGQMASKSKQVKNPAPSPKSHSQDALKYAQDVVAGVIPACRWVVLATQRHIDDLEASTSPDFPFRFDEDKANKPCKFIELLPHVAGKWAAMRQLIKLEPWQKFIVCSLFGWVKKTDGNRRFRKAYICLGRKNAKSTLAAGIALYCLILDGEFGAQVYAGATTEKQAAFVFDPAKKMAAAVPALLEKFGVEVNAQTITVLETNSKFERLIGNPGDGGSPSCYVCDEYHEHDDSRLYDTMNTGTVAREQPLGLVITTAGSNTGGPCYAMQRDVERILEGVIEGSNTFGIIYTIDPTDDWTLESSLIKCNPNWGVSVNSENVRAEQLEAIQSPEKQNIFKTKHMCVWCTAKSGFFNVEKWLSLADSTLNMYSDRFKGKDCVKGLDLGSQIDLAAELTVFTEVIDEKSHYFIFPKFYLPENRAFDPAFQNYQAWVHKKLIVATEGDEIDYEFIKRDVLKDAGLFTVKEFCFDKAQAFFFKQQIQAATGIEATETPQNPMTLSDPMKWLDAMIRSGRVHHDGNEVMTWMVGNVVSSEDANENVFPRKEKPEFKIDGVSALLNCLVRIRETLGCVDQEYEEWTGF